MTIEYLRIGLSVAVLVLALLVVLKARRASLCLACTKAMYDYASSMISEMDDACHGMSTDEIVKLIAVADAIGYVTHEIACSLYGLTVPGMAHESIRTIDDGAVYRKLHDNKWIRRAMRNQANAIAACMWSHSRLSCMFVERFHGRSMNDIAECYVRNVYARAFRAGDD
jgi:hypothetical protein